MAASATSEVRWGIIGCGAVTEVKSGPAFRKVEGSDLVAVMRRDGAKAEDYARRHEVARWYDNAADLIADPNVTAIYVATPPSSHAEHTIAAARAGKPVYVEKPMADRYDRCVEMIDACDAAHVPLFVAYYRRSLPAFIEIRDLVRSGAIGQPRFVSVTLCQTPQNTANPSTLPWRVDPEISGGGYFYDLASHQLDFLDYLFGPVVKVAGHAANQAGWYAAEDIVSASFTFESGVLGNGLWCFTLPQRMSVDRTEIVGTAGSLVYSTFGHTPIRLHTERGAEDIVVEKPPHVEQPLIETVVAELRGHGQCPSTGRSGARTSWVMDQITAHWRGTTGARR